MKIKCLSLKQPFAELIVTGQKTIELRKWNTKYRGPFLIHASKVPYGNEYERFGFKPQQDSLPLGAIVGHATLVDVKHYSNFTEWIQDKDKHCAGDEFYESTYGFILKDAMKLEKPIPLLGKLNFFDVDIDLVSNHATHWVQ